MAETTRKWLLRQERSRWRGLRARQARVISICRGRGGSGWRVPRLVVDVSRPWGPLGGLILLAEPEGGRVDARWLPVRCRAGMQLPALFPSLAWVRRCVRSNRAAPTSRTNNPTLVRGWEAGSPSSKHCNRSRNLCPCGHRWWPGGRTRSRGSGGTWQRWWRRCPVARWGPWRAPTTRRPRSRAAPARAPAFLPGARPSAASPFPSCMPPAGGLPNLHTVLPSCRESCFCYPSGAARPEAACFFLFVHMPCISGLHSTSCTCTAASCCSIVLAATLAEGASRHRRSGSVATPRLFTIIF